MISKPEIKSIIVSGVTLNVEFNFPQVTKAKLGKFESRAVEILFKIHQWLREGYERAVYQQEIPVLLYADPNSATSVKKMLIVT